MSEQRMNQIEKTANDIISALSDLQLVILHHPEISQANGRTDMYEKLTATKKMASTLMRRETRVAQLDPVTAVRVQVVNGLNCLSAMLSRNVLRGGVDGLDDCDLRKIRNMAVIIGDRIDVYEKMQREASDARPAA